MRNLIARYVVGCALLFAALQCFAQVPSTHAGLGTPAVSGNITGPGDIVSFTFWCGFRAYSNATKATKAIRVVRASDSTQQDINTLSDGTLDASTLTTFLTSTTGKVVTCYDKVSTNDATQGTDANRPAVTASALGSSYCMTFAGGQTLVGANITQNQVYSLVAISNPTSNVGDEGLFGIDPGTFAGALLQYQSGTPNYRIYAGGGTLPTQAAALNTWHANQGIFNGASSVNALDGAEVTGDAGADNLTAYPLTIGASGTGSQLFTGKGCEYGYIGATISSGNRTSLNTNMHAAYGGF